MCFQHFSGHLKAWKINRYSQDSKWTTGVLSTSAHPCSPNLRRERLPRFNLKQLKHEPTKITQNQMIGGFQQFQPENHVVDQYPNHPKAGKIAPLGDVFAPPRDSRLHVSTEKTLGRNSGAPGIMSRPQSDFS